MNHWFLCARDLMWFVLAVYPLFAAFGCGMIKVNEIDPPSGFQIFLMWSGCMVQVIGIACLYLGVIK